MEDLKIESQGRLLKVKVTSVKSKMTPRAWSKRGVIRGFSRTSRKRMLELGARLDIGVGCRFVTLTFADDNIPCSFNQAKSYLRALLERVRRSDNGVSIIWRMEPVARKSGKLVGAIVPHFHLIVFNASSLALPDEENPNYSGFFHEAWEAVTSHHSVYADDGKNDLRTDDKLVVNAKQLMYYVAKYAAKIDKEGGTLVTVSYLHAGRFWGVFNRSGLPFAKLVKMALKCPSKAFFDLRRGARKKYRAMRAYGRVQGFSLFVSDGGRWIDYIFFCLTESYVGGVLIE